MKANQYRAALSRLYPDRGLYESYELVAKLFKISLRTAQGYALGDYPVPEAIAIVLRLLAAGHEARIRELEKGLSGRTKPTKPTPIDPDSEVARLKNTVRELRAKLRELNRWHTDEMHKHGKMPLTTFAAIVKCLHPDRPPPTEKERADACGLFTQWKKGQDGR